MESEKNVEVEIAEEAVVEQPEKNKKCGKKKVSEKELLQQIENLTAENQKLVEQNAEISKKAEEYKQSWYRTAADFENFKKRNNETRMNAYADGRNDVLKSVLPIGDVLHRAIESVQDEQTKVGLELVIKQYCEILKNIGVEEIDPVGEVFDPNLHEAVYQVENDNEENSGKIQSVFKKGYAINGKMLRYAQVVVYK